MNKHSIRNEAFNYLGTYGKNIKEKFKNICGKTGQRDIPSELYQKRTHRSNRVLMPWKTVYKNKLTLEQLDTFEGGIVVEFVNEDFFNPEYSNDPTYSELRKRIGSDENVSSIITIRSEGGESSSSVPRKAFAQLVSGNTMVMYKGQPITLTKDNYKKYAITQIRKRAGTGNDTWNGFLFVSIRGGQQDTIQTHEGIEYTLFNPATDYASQDVCDDIDLVVAYFAMLAINVSAEKKAVHDTILNKIVNALKATQYNLTDFKGTLYDYCKNHYSVSLIDHQLTDPIQIKPIKIEYFDIKHRANESIDLTHNEAVIHNNFYWDAERKTVLSPARPTNIFWSLHLSNMMQQDYDLEQYFLYEEERFNKRKELIINK